MQTQASGSATERSHDLLVVAAGYQTQFAVGAGMTVLLPYALGHPLLAFLVWAFTARLVAGAAGAFVIQHVATPVIRHRFALSALYAAGVVAAYGYDWRIGAAVLMVSTAFAILVFGTEREWRRLDAA
jgi:hypothetical protein